MSYNQTVYSRYRCYITRETEKAILLTFEEVGVSSGEVMSAKQDIWFPKSVFKLDSDMETIYIADWFVDKNSINIYKFKY